MAISQADVVDYIKNLKLSEVKGLIEILEEELLQAVPAVVLSPKRRRQSSTSSSRLLATRRLPSSRQSVPRLVLASRKPRTSSRVHPTKSRQLFPRKRPRLSRRSSRQQAQKQRSSNHLVVCAGPSHGAVQRDCLLVRAPFERGHPRGGYLAPLLEEISPLVFSISQSANH